MAGGSLGNAKKAKNDEFYTVYDYIQKEMNAYILLMQEFLSKGESHDYGVKNRYNNRANL